MLAKILATTVRHRRAVLVVETVLAAIVVAVEAWTRALGPVLFLAVIVIAVICLVLVFGAQRSYRPAVLTVRADGPSLDTPVSPMPVLAFTAFVGMSTVNLTGAVRRIAEREELWQLDAVITGLYLTLLAVWFRAAWGHIGVRLRPDGVLDRRATGTLFVPWEAFDRSHPAWPAERNDRLSLNYEGPARRRGILITRPRAMTGFNVNRWFLARAIHHYVNHPEDRAAIGTETEYQRAGAG